MELNKITSGHHHPMVLAETGHFIPPRSRFNKMSNFEFRTLNPDVTVPTTALASANNYSLFKLSRQLDIIHKIFLKFTLTNNGGTADTPQVQTIYPYNMDAGGGASTPDGGSYYIETPFGRTSILAFGETAANIQIALRAVDDTYATVTVAGTMITNVAITLVNVIDPDILVGVSVALLDGAVPVILSNTITTAYAPGDDVLLGVAPIFIQKCEVEIGNQIMETIYGEHFWHMMTTRYTHDEISGVATVNGFDSTTFTTNNYLRTGESKTYYVPIDNLINLAEIPVGVLNRTQFLMRIYFNSGATALFETFPGSIASTAVITDIAISNITLRMIGEILRPDQRVSKLKEVRSVDHSYKWSEHERHIISAGARTAATQYEEKFTIKGKVSHMFIHPRLTTATKSSDLYEPLKFTSWEVTDSGGKSLTGDILIEDDFSRNVISPHLFRSKVFTKKNIYLWSPDTDPHRTLLTQSIHGSIDVRNEEHLRYVMNATNTIQIFLWVNTLKVVTIFTDGSAVKHGGL